MVELEKLFGYIHHDIKPDIVCCGKGAGSGYPLSLVLGHKKIMDLPKEGEMSSTHSANPLACAIGNATINEIRKKINKNASKKGKLLHNELNKLKEKISRHNKIYIWQRISCIYNFLQTFNSKSK